MTLSTRTLMLGAAAAFLALAGAQGVSSAPAPLAAKPAAVSDEAFRPGMDGVDLAAITGPRGPASGKVPACADPARRGDLRPC